MLAWGSSLHRGSASSMVPAAAASMVETNRMHEASARVPAYHSVPAIFPMNAVSFSRCLFAASVYASVNQNSRTSMGDLSDRSSMAGAAAAVGGARLLAIRDGVRSLASARARCVAVVARSMCVRPL